MSDRIEPALTAEEWAAQMAVEPDMPRPASVAHFGGVLVVRVPGQGACNVPPSLVPALAAFANAVRDDSDPGKITWAMVDRIQAHVDTLSGVAAEACHMATQLHSLTGHTDPVDLERQSRAAVAVAEVAAWRTIAANLAATLPPREPNVRAVWVHRPDGFSPGPAIESPRSDESA